MSEIDMLHEALEGLKQEIRSASLRLAEYVKQYGDDPVAHGLADRIMVAIAEEKRYRRLLVSEVAG